MIPSRLLTVIAIAAAPLFVVSCSNIDSTDEAGPPPELAAAATMDFSADPAAFGVFDDAVAAAGKDLARLNQLEEDLIILITEPTTTFAAKQAIAQRLATILQVREADQDSDSLKVLARMLRHEDTVEIGRLALEPVPGDHIDALFMDALDRTEGPAKVAVMQAIGARLIEDAVSTIAALIEDSDPDVARMAVTVLGQIDGADAFAALEKASGSNEGYILDARLAAASRAAPRVAAAAYEAILRDRSIALEKRAMALRGILDARPDSAVGQIHEALMASELIYHQVATEAIRDLPDPETSAKIAENLEKYEVSVQIPAIEALGNRGDASAVPGLLAMLDSDEPAVRVSALQALSRLPSSVEVARRIANIAQGTGSETRSATEALARLDGPGIDAMIIDQARNSASEARLFYIDQLARRNLTEAIPFLLGLKGNPDSDLRNEALDALRAIASPSEQKALIQWALDAPDRAEQSRAIRALITLTLRMDSVETRGSPILASMAEGDSDTRLTLMPVLSRIGGEPALETAKSIALTADEEVAIAAANELGRWPDKGALAPLVEIAEQSSSKSVSEKSTQSAARLIERGDATERAYQCELVTRLLALPASSATKNRLLVLLRRCADEASVALAEQYLADPDTKAEAKLAAEAIRANLAWPPALEASNEGDSVGNVADGDPRTLWVVPGSAGEWLFVDLRISRPITKVILEHTGRVVDYPSVVEVFVSESPEKPAEPVMVGNGKRTRSVFSIPEATHGRYLWLSQTGQRNNEWATAELIVE